MVFKAVRDRQLELTDWQTRSDMDPSTGDPNAIRFWEGEIRMMMQFDRQFDKCDEMKAFKEIDAMKERMMDEPLRGEYLLTQLESLEKIKEILIAFNAMKENNRFTLDVI
jgi:hypothetical protein